MRLRRLEFCGIGSFADTMEIDFEALGAAGMFLVEGPTGSGKSTILDAIVFALYGNVAGSGSDLGRLDSHLRDRHQPPYVELDFTCGEATYRIRRTPRHERDKRRGAGTMRDEGAVSLVQLTPDQVGISHRAKEVGDWVIEHVGLTKQQFVSTIVLAQGEFATFLDADTASRAQILEKVFGTQFYKHVEDQLAAMRKAAIERRAAAGDGLAEIVHRCLGVLGIAESSDPAADIEAARVELDVQWQQARDEVQAADQARAAAQEQHSAAQSLIERQERKQALLARMGALTADEPRVEQIRAALSEHDRAVPAVAAIAAWRRAQAEFDTAQTAAAGAARCLQDAGGGPPDPASVAELAALLGHLRVPAEVESQIPALQERERSAAGQAEVAQRQAAARTAELAEVAAELERLDAARLDDAAPRAALAELQARAATLQASAAAWQRLAATEEELAQAGAGLETAARELQAAQQRSDLAREAADRDQAAALANRLVDGQPCLVCGATEHPSPASRSVGTSPGLAAAAHDLDAAREQWLAVKGRVDRLEGVAGSLREGLSGSPASVADEIQQVDADVRQARSEVEAITAAAAHRERLTARSAALQGLLVDERVAAERAAAAHTAARDALTSAQEQVEVAADGHQTVAARIASVRSVHDAMTAALVAATRQSSAREVLERAADVLQQTLAGVGLADVEAVERALLDEGQASRIRGEVTAHDRARDEVRGALSEVADVDISVAPDLAALAAALDACTRSANAARERLARVEHTRADLQPLLEVLEQRRQQRQDVLSETAGVIRMAELASAARGEVMHRVRLSSFVLMRRFEAVVEAANDRLDAISEGRYQLRVETEGLDSRGQAGLDLLIEDQRTERCRSTKSLSGGERFYVSLALALGLADVVRSESGGVRLGTLFIDEGFGSLDADVLEEVMDMLEQVRAGEDRVIGLVSHVDLLKQRIDPRISVRRDPQRPGVSTLAVTV